VKHQRLIREVFFSSIDLDQSCASTSSVASTGTPTSAGLVEGSIICVEAIVVEDVFQMIAPTTATRRTTATTHSIIIHQRLSEDESLIVAVILVEVAAAVALVERPALIAAALKFDASDVLPVLDSRVFATACASSLDVNVI